MTDAELLTVLLHGEQLSEPAVAHAAETAGLELHGHVVFGDNGIWDTA